jgi:tetratricopeptide (TPR) repeat protein
MSADRNLLFGVLALQMDFINRDALIKAMNAWVLEKAKPLGQILLEQGAIQPEDRSLLDTMVCRHLELHGNAEKSLAALSSIGSVRKELEGMGDPEVQSSLVHVSAARPPDDDPYATRASSVGTPTASGLRFRILRPHAKGGLGQVSVARDEELHREVALKEIQDRYADDAGSRARFLLEAEITGGLEHPGVVPVYGLGCTPDGRPYYAMRFIRGDSLKEAIERLHKAESKDRDPGEQAVAFRGLLGRFVDVCNAVAYAHSRGILHRDLKPGNVMLGKYGETLVVDWGLAKPLGQTEANSESEEAPLVPSSADSCSATQAGQAVGTPAFMSPEQATGRLDLLGPASDIYGLGAALYALLTGRPPIEAREQGEVLRKVQQGDWPAPRQMKQEVPKALEAICLKAMALKPEDRYCSALELAGDIEHWLADEPVRAYAEPLRVRAGRWGRRHQTLVTAGAAAILVVILLGGAGAWWLDRQRTQLRQAVEADLAEVVLLQEQARWAEARTSLGRADARLGSDGPEDLHRRLEQMGRDLDLVARLDSIRLESSMSVTGRGFDFKGADRRYAAEFAEAGLGAVGDDPQVVADRVRDSAVRAALVAALDDWAMSAEGQPSRWEWLLEVARQADPDPWRDHLRSPRAWQDPAVLKQLASDEKATEQAPRLIAALAGRLQIEGEDATGLLRKAQALHPDDFWLNHQLGMALALRDPREAVGYYRAALALRPGNVVVLTSLGTVLAGQGRLEEAKAEFRKALQSDARFSFARVSLGDALVRQGRLQEAEAEYREASAIDPKSVLPHAELGQLLAQQGRLSEAEAECHRAVEVDPEFDLARLNLAAILEQRGRLEEAKKQYQFIITRSPNWAPAHNQLGQVLMHQGKWQEAEAEFRRSIALLERGGEALRNTATARFQRDPADKSDALAHSNLGSLLQEQGRLEEAEAEFRKAIKIHPNDAFSRNGLGTVLGIQGRLEEAKPEFLKAIELDPKFAGAHNNLGNVLGNQGRLEEAKAEYLKAIKLDPKFAPAHHHLGKLLGNQGRLEEAKAEFLKAIKLDPKLADAHYCLGYTLSRQGRLEEAKAQLGQAVALGLKAAAAQMHQCEVWLALTGRLPTVLQGKDRPRSAAERIQFADLCRQPFEKHYVASARLYADAFAADAKLAENLQSANRYNAACSAALAAAGQGKDVAKLDDKDKARLRGQALAWLKADLALRTKQTQSARSQDRIAAQGALRYWQQDTDLASVRDSASVAKLPQAERAEWEKLWADVAALLDASQQKKP